MNDIERTWPIAFGIGRVDARPLAERTPDERRRFREAAQALGLVLPSDIRQTRTA